MTLSEFREAARQLRFIDYDQVKWMGRFRWERFRKDPIGFVLSEPDADAERIWDIVQERRYAKLEGRE